MNQKLSRRPSALLSVVPILVLVVLLSITIRTFGSDALGGGSQIVLLTSTAVCSVLAMSCCRVSWKAIETAICNNILGVSVAIIILIICNYEFLYFMDF